MPVYIIGTDVSEQPALPAPPAHNNTLRGESKRKEIAGIFKPLHVGLSHQLQAGLVASEAENPTEIIHSDWWGKKNKKKTWLGYVWLLHHLHM